MAAGALVEVERAGAARAARHLEEVAAEAPLRDLAVLVERVAVVLVARQEVLARGPGLDDVEVGVRHAKEAGQRHELAGELHASTSFVLSSNLAMERWML